MMEELSKKELAQAKIQARRLRISNIRRRVATGAVIMVALFTGLVMYRSIDQQAANTTANTSANATASVTRSEEDSGLASIIGATIVDGAFSVFSDDDEEGGSVVSTSSGSDPAPMTSSQS